MVRGRKNPLHYGLSSRLRKARKTAGLTRNAVVQRVGGDQGTVRDIETSQRLPTVATIARLAAALSCSASYLAYAIALPTSESPPATCEGMGARLQAVRVERSISRAELARLTDLSPRAIAKVEAGGQSGVEVVEALAQALGISPAWLAFNQGPQVLPLRRLGRPPAQSTAPAE